MRQRLELRCHKRRHAVGAARAGSGKEGSSLRGFGQSMALLTSWFQTSSLQNGERINFSFLKPPGLWYFAIADLGN